MERGYRVTLSDFAFPNLILLELIGSWACWDPPQASDYDEEDSGKVRVRARASEGWDLGSSGQTEPPVEQDWMALLLVELEQGARGHVFGLSVSSVRPPFRR